MKKRNPQLAVTLTTALALISLLGACGRAPAPDVAKNIRVAETPLTVPQSIRTQLTSIHEAVPAQGLQVWLNKEFWINRSIWVSLGVERASLTGLAMSVDGYHAAKLTRAGSYLVLVRDNSGLYGGSVLGPEIPINAYPIVGESTSEILVDLSAPKTPYGLTMNNFYAGNYSDTELAPRFEYVRAVQATAESLSFISVTSTKSPIALFSPNDNTAEALSGQDPFMLSMTLRTDWILPTENPSFIQKIANSQTLGFFLSSPRVVENGAGAQRLVQKIATDKPFVWQVSSNTPEEFRPAIEQGVLGWNSAFGSDVLQVSYAAEELGSITDPKVSNLVWDDNLAVGYAFANWRSNPATGEIVQAQVYLSGAMWAQGARITYQLRDIDRQIRESGNVARSTRPGSVERSRAASSLNKARAELKKLSKETSLLAKSTNSNRRMFVSLNTALAAQRARSNEYCFRTLELERNLALMAAIDADLDAALRDLDRETAAVRQDDLVSSEHEVPTHMPYPPEGMDMETFAQFVVRGVVMHEIGHTLGLRHNFMGSLGTSNDGEVQSASIMDYNDEVIDAQFAEPGSYDKLIVQSEYFNQPIVEDFKFCTDEHVMKGLPTCSPFDFSADPLLAQHIVEDSHLSTAQLFLYFGQVELAMQLILRGLNSNIQKIQYALFPAELGTQFLQDPTFAESQKSAWKLIQQSMNMQDIGGYPVQFMQIYREALISYVTRLTTAESANSGAAPEITSFYKEVLVDSEGVYSLATRRMVLTGLQTLQSAGGHLALSLALKELTTQIEEASEETEPSKIAEDQDTLVSVRKILEQDGYYKVDLN
jgi:hypothetical protein